MDNGEIFEGMLMKVLQLLSLQINSSCQIMSQRQYVITQPTQQLFFENVCHSIYNTVELQWLKHLWNHENMFKTKVG